MRQSRIFKAGRPTTGYRRGKQILSPVEVQVGDKLIGVSHHFEAENLYRVTDHHRNRFIVVYIQPNGRKADGGEMCVWAFNLTLPTQEWLRAVRRKAT